MNNISFFDVVYHDTELRELNIDIKYNGCSNISFILEDTENNIWRCSFNNIQRVLSDIYLNYTGNAILSANISQEDSLYQSFIDSFKTEVEIHCYVIETTSGTLKFLTKDYGEFMKL